MKKSISWLLVLMLMVGLSACGGKDANVIRIGLLTPNSGVVAEYGVAVKKAVELGAEEINAAGGINGKKIELINYDTEGDQTKAINLFNKLVSSDKIDALIGPVTSNPALAVAPLAEEEKIPMITPTGTNLKITPERSFVFRTCYTDPYQGEVACRFAVDNLKVKTAAVLYNVGSDYSTGLAEAFQRVADTEGIKITSWEGYNSDDKDFSAVITKIKENEPDVIFIPDYYGVDGIIAGQIKASGLKSALLGGDGWDGVLKEFAENAEGAYYASHFSNKDTEKRVKEFVDAYQAKYDELPSSFAALGYDAMYMMEQAIKEAGEADGQKIQEKLAAIDYNGVTGHLRFDENGDPSSKTVTIIKVVDGQATIEAKVAN